MTRLFTRLLLCLALLPLAAGATTALRLLQTSDAARDVQLRSLHVSSHISGGLALTRLDMQFYNPHARVLEGQLQFPLADGQQITDFALDINGELRPAVAVEKVRARQVFEAIVRRGVDPALLEKTAGNQFRLRVYPLPARGMRRVQLEYMEALGASADHSRWRLPLNFGPVSDFRLSITVSGQRLPPQVDGGPWDLQWVKQAGGWQAHYAGALTGNSEVRLRSARAGQELLRHGERDQHWFYAELPLPAQTSARQLPSQLHILWDASTSGAQRDHSRELQVLDGYLRRAGNLRVTLQRLRNQPERPLTFTIRNGQWQALRRELENTVYDGASALSSWRPQGDGDYLLFSDGQANYGAPRWPALSASSRLYAISSSASADSGRLRAVSQRYGGRFISVDDVPSAVQALLGITPRLHGVSGDGVQDVHGELHGQSLRLAGRWHGGPVQLQVQIQLGDRLQVQTLQLDGSVSRHPLAARQWASYRLQALEAEPELNRAAIRRLGEQFRLPTRETSLLVLESVQDHVRYNIEPPADWRAEFERLRRQQQDERQAARQHQLDQIAQAFAEKIVWWERDFPKGPRPQPKLARRRLAQAAGSDAMASAPVASIGSADAMEMAAPAAPPPPAPLAERSAMAARKAGAPGTSSASIGIALQKWQSDARYMQRLRNSPADQLYAVYLDERDDWRNSSAFYVDVADLLLDKGQTELGLRVLSNLAEMDSGNVQILRLLGYRLQQAGQLDEAIRVLQQVRDLAADEPQSWRDLGLALAAAGRNQAAIEQLYEVVQRPWDGRFADIELIALAELNAIIAGSKQRLDTRLIDRRLLRNLPLDLRVVLSWDANDSDMDLWVTDPNGEKCYYGNRNTWQGGRMSRDFTGGYGPEEYSLRVAKPGVYRIEANYYGSRQQIIAGATSLKLTLTTGFGTPRQRTQTVILRLKEQSETVFIGEFRV